MADPFIKEILDEGAKHVGQTLPFVVGAMQKAPELSRTRIIEAVIIASVIGMLSVGFTVYVTMPQIQLEIEHVKESLKEMKDSIHEIRRDLMKPRQE